MAFAGSYRKNDDERKKLTRSPNKASHLASWPAFANGKTARESHEKNLNPEINKNHFPRLQPEIENEILRGDNPVLIIKPDEKGKKAEVFPKT